MNNLQSIYQLFPKEIFIYILEYINPISLGVVAFRQAERNRVNRLILGALSRRKDRIPDTEEHWVFGFPRYNPFGQSLQLQAINCKFCGNYAELNGYPIKIQCRCDEDEFDGW
jgi:hypothetical protein